MICWQDDHLVMIKKSSMVSRSTQHLPVWLAVAGDMALTWIKQWGSFQRKIKNWMSSDVVIECQATAPSMLSLSTFSRLRSIICDQSLDIASHHQVKRLSALCPSVKCPNFTINHVTSITKAIFRSLNQLFYDILLNRKRCHSGGGRGARGGGAGWRDLMRQSP